MYINIKLLYILKNGIRFRLRIYFQTNGMEYEDLFDIFYSRILDVNVMIPFGRKIKAETHSLCIYIG